MWKYKAMALRSYARGGFAQSVIRYEDLLEDPEQTLRTVLSDVGLSWNRQVLEHERHHAGRRYRGSNRGDRALDKSRLRHKDDLSDEEREIVKSVCASEMSQWNYD